MPGDASTMPAQQRVGGDYPALTKPTGERCGNRGEQSPVIIVDGWPVNLAAEYQNLVT